MPLRWGSDSNPGITRQRSGRGFTYSRPDGSRVRDTPTLARIRSLAIPPAWKDVWISPDPLGHIQATGRDARKRKQYRYHPWWREEHDAAKYDRMIAFAEALPGIRSRVAEDLSGQGLSRDRVLAVIVRLLDVTMFRIGNAEYARENRSYGLTTLQTRHVAIDGDTIRLSFRGKGGKRTTASIHDRRVARVLQRCTALPGEELFQYVDDHGDIHNVGSDDVNAYLRDIAGDSFSAKDFRTWAGTVITARTLSEMGPAEGRVEAKRMLQSAINAAAAQLGNTAAVCRRCYLHPDIPAAYRDGSLAKMRFGVGPTARRHAGSVLTTLRPEERATLRLLKRSPRGAVGPKSARR
jgi:DNA topoisomerase I